MNALNKILKTGAILVSVAVGMTVFTAQAATVNCPGTIVATDREFSITPTSGGASCLDYGTGNLSGNPGGSNPDPLLDVLDAAGHYLGAGYGFIDKWTTVGGGSNLNDILTGTGAAGTGTWAFALLAPSGYVWDLVIAFKSGRGRLSPDWAAFALTGGASSGTWTISSQGLSHINLYGKLVEAPSVPLPAGAPLLLAGLGALALLRRKPRS